MKKRVIFLWAVLYSISGYSQSFSSGNLLVVRSGDNTQPAAAGTYSTIYLDEYTTAGTLVNTHAVTGLVGDGGSTNEGYYQLSPNGMYLAVGGYAKNTGESRTIATDGTGDLAKVQIYGSAGTGSILKSYTLPAGVFSTGNPDVAGQVINARFTGTAALNDGSGLYAGGGSTNLNTGGVFYINNNANTGNINVFNQVQTTQSNLRVPGIFSGQLFTSGNAAALGNATAIRLGSFSNAMPVSANSETVTNLPGTDFSISTGSGGIPINICQYIIYDADAAVSGYDVLFVTDDGSTGGHKGGIKKYVKNGSGNWSLKYELSTGTGPADVNNYKFRGLTGMAGSEKSVTFYATAFDPGDAVYKVVKFTDPDIYGSASAPVLSTLVTAPSGNYVFKGISFTPGSTLPLKLTSFNIHLQLNSLVLNWTTEQEDNVDRFEIERSFDGKYFELRGTVISKNTPGRHSYSSTDETNFSGTAYYRLKMIDRDGSYTYSTIKAVENSNDIKIYPNPASDELTVQYNLIHTSGKLEIYNAVGKKMYQTDLRANSTSIKVNVRSLPAGNYIVKMDINNQIVTRKIIIE